MKLLENAWHHVLVEPYIWIWQCFTQPIAFTNHYDAEIIGSGKSLLDRLLAFRQLPLPIFITSYPIALFGHFFLLKLSGQELHPSAFLLITAQNTVLGIAIGIAVGIAGSWEGAVTGGVVGYIAGSISFGSTGGGIAFAIVFGVMGAVLIGSVISIIGAIMLGIALGIVGDATSDTLRVMLGSFTLIILYLVIYLRLPFYPFSALSQIRSYYLSKKNKSRVFTYLHDSSLYRDERLYLPLPQLKNTLFLAINEDVEKTLEEIAFILEKRPDQAQAALSAWVEIAIRSFEEQRALSEIASISHHFSAFIPRAIELIDNRWIAPFISLNDASLDAARYCNLTSSRAVKRSALEDMVKNLKKARSYVILENIQLKNRLNNITEKWLDIALHEQEILRKTPQDIGLIDNPFNPGQVLSLNDSLFVGRQDLAQQLDEALNRDKGFTFLLNGERRMGKSSTLRQLPSLLGAHYLPIYYDLQSPGIYANSATFLGTLSDEIYKGMISRGIRVEQLKYNQLQNAAIKNDAAVYSTFNRWLMSMENILKREDRLLLLTFDEFEKLEEVRNDGHFNVRLLLDWFRSTIQHHPQLTLLFSGVRTLGEMGMNWAGYFVNVQTIRVSFLKPEEAHRLICEPTQDFPGQEIFGEEAVEKIIVEVGGHPFLIQAVCSVLIDILNTRKRNQATCQDVTEAVHEVLKKWWETYFRDLWERTDANQRTCLQYFQTFGKGDLQKIVQQTGLDEKVIQSSLQRLQYRDLVQELSGEYRIAAPIFENWVEWNSSSY